MERSTLIAWQLCLATTLGLSSMACGSAPAGPAARRVVLSAPEGNTNLSEPNSEPSSACRAVCKLVQSAGERVAACELAHGSPSLTELVPDSTFVVCKLERR